MRVIKIVGLASGTTREISFSQNDLDKNLLIWLRDQEVTIASSCDGQGICKKCVIQNDWLTCEMTLRDLLEKAPEGKVVIGYL
jgi:hypothetical protein